MTTKDYQTRSPLRIFLSYFKPHRRLFALDLSCAFLIACIDLAFPLVSRAAMYTWLPQRQFRVFFIVMAVVVAAYVLRSALYFVVAYWGHTFGIRVEADIRRDLYRHIQELGFDFYDRNRTGQLMSRLTSDLFELTELAHHGPEDLFISLVTIVGALAVMFTLRWELALVLLVLLPVLLTMALRRRRQMSAASRAAKVKTGTINAAIESGLSGVRTTKAFANEEAQQQRFDEANEVFKTAKRGFHKEMGRFNAVMEFCTGILPVAVIAVGGWLIMGEKMDYVDLITFSLYVTAFVSPIRKLANGAQEIAAGNYDVAIRVEHHDEIGRLAEDFNHMAAEVKRSTQLEKDILANVSHDLRTPLTLIKGYAETVRDLTGSDDAKRTEQCSIIVDETNRLSTLVNSVMELSKVQSGAERPNLVDFDMSDLCFEVAGRYDALCDKNHWQLDLQANEPCPVSADPAMMERVMHNLLGNAFHHIGADGVVVLRAIPQEKGCRIEIEDHGPGIPPEDLPYIFDRYYRARQDSGRTGTGLGLSITKAILQQHGFAFGVDSAVGRGSTFWFEMKDTRK